MNNVCQKCQGKKRYMDKNGVLQPCWDCLNRGDLDQHDKHPKDSGIKI